MMLDKLDEVYRERLARPSSESIDDCKQKAEQRVRSKAQDSVRADGWPQCKRCKMNLELVVSSNQTFSGDGAEATGKWSRTCKSCGKYNG